MEVHNTKTKSVFHVQSDNPYAEHLTDGASTSNNCNMIELGSATACCHAIGRAWLSVSNGTDSSLILVAWYPAPKPEGD